MKRSFSVLCFALTIALLVSCSPPRNAGARRPESLALVYEVPEPLQESTEPSYIPTIPDSINYLIWFPADYEESTKKSYPLLVYLHGGESSSVQVGDGSTQAFKGQMGLPLPLHERQREFPFIVLMPQSTSPDDSWMDHVEIVDSLIGKTIETHRVDPERVYVMGFSMGGAGTLAMVGIHPERFAAGVAIGGYYPGGLNQGSICDFPGRLWIFHSERDRAVPWGFSVAVTRQLDTCGKDYEFTSFLLESHSETAEKALSDPEVYRWLLRQSLTQE
jgi:predicted peptidase